jgi:hypothetical protein
VSNTDRTTNASLGATYAATRSLQLGCTASHVKRSVGSAGLVLTYPFSLNTAGCSAQFALNL